MDRTRLALLITTLVVVLPLTLGGAVVLAILARMPAAQGDRVRGPDGIVGRQASGSFVWFVPSDTGYLLVDAGLDPTGEAIERERGGRPIQAVLLTHAHADHTAGLASLPGVPVYVGAADHPLLVGDEAPSGLLPRWVSAVAPAVELGPTQVTEVADGEVIEVDGVRIRATHLPGHTPGSTAWLVGSTLFTGDAFLGGAEPGVMGAAFTGDVEQAEASLERLLPLDFEAIADGHVGLTTTARSTLHRVLGHAEENPEVSLSPSPVVTDGEARAYGGTVERQVQYVQALVPDAHGLQPADLVGDDGLRWRLSETPIEAHRVHWGQQVRVRGQPFLDPAVPPTQPRITRFELERIDPIEGVQADPPTTTPIADAEGLQARVGQWVAVTGELDGFAPLTESAAWGEGQLTLPDGFVVALSAPVAGHEPQGAVQAWVHIRPEADSLRLVSRRMCADGDSSCDLSANP